MKYHLLEPQITRSVFSFAVAWNNSVQNKWIWNLIFLSIFRGFPTTLGASRHLVDPRPVALPLSVEFSWSATNRVVSDTGRVLNHVGHVVLLLDAVKQVRHRPPGEYPDILSAVRVRREWHGRLLLIVIIIYKYMHNMIEWYCFTVLFLGEPCLETRKRLTIKT